MREVLLFSWGGSDAWRDRNDRVRRGTEGEASQVIVTGSRVRFKSHGETGLTYTVTDRLGDDCELLDYRGRELKSVPAELLVCAPCDGQPCKLCTDRESKGAVP